MLLVCTQYCNNFLTPNFTGKCQTINMSKVKVTFSNKLAESDPLVNPVIILGKLENLKQVPYDVIKAKLEPRVSEEVN